MKLLGSDFSRHFPPFVGMLLVVEQIMYSTGTRGINTLPRGMYVLYFNAGDRVGPVKTCIIEQ
jgi:hypothetical protein